MTDDDLENFWRLMIRSDVPPPPGWALRRIFSLLLERGFNG